MFEIALEIDTTLNLKELTMENSNEVLSYPVEDLPTNENVQDQGNNDQENNNGIGSPAPEVDSQNDQEELTNEITEDSVQETSKEPTISKSNDQSVERSASISNTIDNEDRTDVENTDPTQADAQEELSLLQHNSILEPMPYRSENKVVNSPLTTLISVTVIVLLVYIFSRKFFKRN